MYSKKQHGGFFGLLHSLAEKQANKKIPKLRESRADFRRRQISAFFNMFSNLNVPPKKLKKNMNENSNVVVISVNAEVVKID